MTDAPSGLQPVEASAKRFFTRALEHCSMRSGMSPEIVLEQLRAGDPEMHGTLRYALAKGLGEYLGGLGVAFRAVYVYGSAMAETSSPCSDIDIILDLERDNDQVDRLVRGLDVALVTQFRVLFPWAHKLNSLLDVRTVAAPADARKEIYRGGLLGSWTSPVCVWRVRPGYERSSPPVGGPSPLRQR